jgi:1-pyrroline-5-carboxylate dehydrogenase
MVNEIFGPVITVYVYEDEDFEKTCELIDTTTQYALTGSIFAAERSAVVTAQRLLRNAAGSFSSSPFVFFLPPSFHLPVYFIKRLC